MIKQKLLIINFAILLAGCYNITEPEYVSNTSYLASKDLSYQINRYETTIFRIQGINGKINLRTCSGDTVINVAAKCTVKSESRDDAEEHLDLLKVLISTSSSEIIVYTEQPENTQGRLYQVDYDILLPESMKLRASNVNGNISVDTLLGGVNIGLVNGDIVLNNQEGNINIDLTNGNVRVPSHAGNSEINVVNGSIYLKTDLPQNGSCELNNVNGIINLRIPVNTSAEFSAKVTNGGISLSNLDLSNINISKKEAEGILGDGSGSIALSVVNGTIDVQGF